jgi:hypothetical protein
VPHPRRRLGVNIPAVAVEHHVAGLFQTSISLPEPADPARVEEDMEAGTAEVG